MKGDIENKKVSGIGIAIVPRNDDDQLWDTYIVNFKDEDITCLLINSSGYGKVKDKEVKTTVLRHYIEKLDARSFAKIEPIQVDLFRITNEYWVSFYWNEFMYDKKFIFVLGSIDELNFAKIDVLDLEGVLIK